MVLSALACLTALATSNSIAANSAGNACEREIERAAKRYGVPTGILYAVGLTETGNRGSLQANTLNIHGKAVFAKSRADAISTFNAARESGQTLIDLGCMQINHRYHSQHFTSVADMLDPALNVDYAARFLKELVGRHGNWTMAVARYHAGPDNDPAQKRYVCRVITNLVASGFGEWTAQAKNFCDT
ncbi:lytic transglycosylase domain-containing protein [Limoniibacter endophyticus]|uniref:Lytic transglycosylase n=1 Tax=Limoniibacter endophyticus TaxID=1565040 RepID=A0A8J3DGN2_9HYPH|nr:lytic transglycosylase domain-containing protein [Limoniibacter endophyticus]GHC64503.1 lytic transglycosylase [Limoniibacter endophyticus]